MMTAASPVVLTPGRQLVKNSLGFFGDELSPYQREALTCSVRRARVSATYAVRRSSMISCAWRSRLNCDRLPS